MSFTKIMTVEQMQDRDKWLELRRTGIGGSEAAVVVFGKSFGQTLFSLWLDKTGQLEKSDDDFDADAKERMLWGQRSESMIAEEFTARTGKKLIRCGMLRSNEHPFMIADVDRLVVGENAIVEIKTTAAWNKEEWAEDCVPDSYVLQALHYLAVTGADTCYFACLLGGQKMVTRELHREDHEEDIEALIEAERNFWENYVACKKLPDVDGTDTCTECLKKLYKGGDEEAIDLDGSIDAEIDNLMDLKAQIKRLETMAQERENKVRLLMGDHEYGRSPKYNVKYSSNFTKTGFNSKQFAKDYPDLYEKYRTENRYRRLLIRESVARKKEREKLNG